MNYTVIIPFYNEFNNVEPLNKALLNNLKKVINDNRKFEIIYVDDGSTDNTFEALKKLNNNEIETIIIKHRNNLSQSAALNTGIGCSKYENCLRSARPAEVAIAKVFVEIRQKESTSLIVQTSRRVREVERHAL